MPQLHILLDFATAPDHEVEERADAVITSLYSTAGTLIYPDPPTQAEMQAIASKQDELILALRRP